MLQLCVAGSSPSRDAYAINGHMLKIGENIFLFTPESVLIVDSEDRMEFDQGTPAVDNEQVYLHDSLG